MKRVLFESQYLRTVSEDGWEWIERTGKNAAVIIFPALLKNGVKHLLLIREYRKPLGGYNWACPAGLMGDFQDETAEDAAVRECVEETGFKPQRMLFLTDGSPSSGLSNEHLTFYLADQLIKVSDQQGVEGEDITVHFVALDEVERFLKAKRAEGDFVDPKVFMALYFVGKADIE